MFQSMTDGPIWEKEFALLVDQEHFEKVWGIMLPNVEQYADSFLTSISNFGNLRKLCMCTLLCGYIQRSERQWRRTA